MTNKENSFIPIYGTVFLIYKSRRQKAAIVAETTTVVKDSQHQTKTRNSST